MSCSRCGYALLPTDTQCPRCGQPVAPPAPMPPEYAQTGHPQTGYPQAGYPPGYYPPRYPNPVNGGLILALGILSILVCNILGPVAWIMANSALSAIDRGEADPAQRGSVNAGRICGIIGTVLILFSMLFVVALVASPEFRKALTSTP